MYENKIEKFTDRLFFKSKTTKSPTQNLSLNFKSLSPLKNNNNLPIQSERGACSNFNKMSTSQSSKNKTNKYQNFRQCKKQLGLSKTDIDRLQLMCADLRADDYLIKLIEIHEQEKLLKDQANLQILDNQQISKSETDKRSQQFQINVNVNYSINKEHQILIKQPDQCRLAVTQCNQKLVENSKKQQELQSEKEQKKICYNIGKKKHNKLDCSKDKTQKNKYKNNEFLFVAKTPKQRMKTHKQKTINQKKNSNQEQFINKKTNKTITKSMTPSINLITDQTDKQNQQQLKVAKNDCEQNIQKQENITQDFIKNCQKVYYEHRQVSNSKKLEEICYAEIGKRMVSVTEKQIRRQFFKVNLHIRSYIMKSIVSYIQYLAQFSPNSIFILPNQRALHYQPNQKPPILSNYLQHTKYIQIIKTINHIIQKNIFKQKYKQSSLTYWPYILFIMLLCLLIMMSLIIFAEQGQNVGNAKDVFMICTGFVICVIMVILVGYSFYCYGTKMEFVPACQVIQQQIQAYFRFVNGKMENDLQWIVGQSFFWVEVKIRTDKDKQNQGIKVKKKQKSFEHFQHNRHKSNFYKQIYSDKKDRIIEDN